MGVAAEPPETACPSSVESTSGRLLTFADNTMEIAYKGWASSAGLRVAWILHSACGVLWLLGLVIYLLALLNPAMARATRCRFVALVCTQAVMVGGQLRTARRLGSLTERHLAHGMEAVKVRGLLVELIGSMVCLMLDDAASPVALIASTIQGVYLVLDQLRLETGLVMHALKVLCFMFARSNDQLLPPAWKQQPLRSWGMEALIYACVALLLPLTVSAVMEVRQRAAFLQRFHLPLSCLGPFWLRVYHIVHMLQQHWWVRAAAVRPHPD